jgi:D-lactate dehydrogenase
MNVAVFSTKTYDRQFLDTANVSHGHKIDYFEPRLSRQTVPLGEGYPAICAFVNDQLDEVVLTHLAENGTRVIALRSAGFNNVDLPAADRLGLTVVRVPAYSPYAVAEHTIGLILALNRRINRAYNRVREGNFALDGLMGFVLRGRTVGVVGTGKIGAATAEILLGFGCEVIASDPYPNQALIDRGVRYADFAELFAQSDIITLHCPLTQDTHHMIDDDAIRQMKPGVMLINTSRGALLDTGAVKFVDATDALGLGSSVISETVARVAFADINGNGWPDLVVDRSRVFLNESKPESAYGRVFREVPADVTGFQPPENGTVVSFADLNNNGHLDAIVAEFIDLHNPQWVDHGRRTGWHPGRGYGTFKGTQVLRHLRREDPEPPVAVRRVRARGWRCPGRPRRRWRRAATAAAPPSDVRGGRRGQGRRHLPAGR